MTNIIAEIGQNAEGSISSLDTLIKEASKHTKYIKLQYWNVSNIYKNNDIRYEACKKRNFDFIFILQTLHNIVKSRNIPVISFFGATREEKLKLFEIPNIIIKYASSEFDVFLNDLNDFEELLNKTIIVSLGLYKKNINMLPFADRINYLSCTPEYPTVNVGNGLRGICDLRRHTSNFGYSDHSIGTDACKAAILLDSKWIEKHFTTENIRRKSSFRDHLGSMTSDELKDLVEFSNRYETNKDDPNFLKKDEKGIRRLKKY